MVAKTTKTDELWAEFTALSRQEQRELACRLLENREFREDLLDLAVILERQGEASRPYSEIVDELKREGRL